MALKIQNTYHHKNNAKMPGTETAICRFLQSRRKYAITGKTAPPIAHKNSWATPNIVLSLGGNNSVAMMKPVIFTPWKSKKFYNDVTHDNNATKTILTPTENVASGVATWEMNMGPIS